MHHHQERPYHVDRTTSRPLCEVKRRRARLVLRWGTTWEALVLFLFVLLLAPRPSFLSLSFFFCVWYLSRMVSRTHVTTLYSSYATLRFFPCARARVRVVRVRVRVRACMCACAACAPLLHTNACLARTAPHHHCKVREAANQPTNPDDHAPNHLPTHPVAARCTHATTTLRSHPPHLLPIDHA